MDMETDSEDEEDGQISKLEEEEEKDRRRFGKPEPEDEPITLEDLNKCRLSREMLAKHCMAPWFEDYIKGMFCCCAKIIYQLMGLKEPGCDTLLAVIMGNLYIAYVR